MSVRNTAVEVLTPLVGSPIAHMCVHSTAMELNKPADQLCPDDLDALERKIRTDMAPFASPELLDRAITAIRMREG